MKIIFDIDGTLTDFNKFVEKNAINYFIEKYQMSIVNSKALEIEDIFDMKDFFITKLNCTDSEAEKKVEDVLNEYWMSYKFIKFSLLGRFRQGVSKIINEFIKKGYDCEIHTSRAKTNDKNLVGTIARNFTIWQFTMNGIFLPREKFYFYDTDEDKLAHIINKKPNLVFEDKPANINILDKYNISTICVEGTHNQFLSETKNVKIIDEFKKDVIQDKMLELLGKKKVEYLNRVALSAKYHDKAKKYVMPIIIKLFNPIILNEENMIQTDEAVVYAPNHRSTLDPLVITSVLKKRIHWAALIRFFQGTDSIFNNSKNPILCKITSEFFQKLEYFPIDRKSDNPEANNFQAIKDMDNFLKTNSNIGIFGEGTTRRPENLDFNVFDDSFIVLATRNDAWIQPITSLWIKELELHSKLIINFGKPFKVGNMSKEEAMNYFMNIQFQNLEENKITRDHLIKSKVKNKR